MPTRGPTRYWALVLCSETFEARRFDSESEALAYAQVHSRLPDTEFVSVDACATNGKRTPIWEWGEVEERRH
jgi:hypothetical protein